MHSLFYYWSYPRKHGPYNITIIECSDFSVIVNCFVFTVIRIQFYRPPWARGCDRERNNFFGGSHSHENVIVKIWEHRLVGSKYIYSLLCTKSECDFIRLIFKLEEFLLFSPRACFCCNQELSSCEVMWFRAKHNALIIMEHKRPDTQKSADKQHDNMLSHMYIISGKTLLQE